MTWKIAEGIEEIELGVSTGKENRGRSKRAQKN